MKHPNLQELATRIHAQNKAAGWWDIPRPRVQTAWLVVTELAEATEAERAGRYADLEAFDYNEKKYGRGREPYFKANFETRIKDTFEDEIADAVIRLLDFAASERVVIEVDHIRPIPEEVNNERVFFYVSDTLSVFSRHTSRGEYLAISVGSLIAVSDRHGFDLWKHVELKLKYNATRGKMHGGKKF